MVTPGSKTRDPSTLTDRGRRRRSALVAGARVVFERDGFVNARITDIADTAGAAHGSFYSYFASKEDIFQAVIEDLQDELTHGRRARSAEAGPTVWDVVFEANCRYLKTWHDNKDLMRLWEDVTTLDDEILKMFDATRMAFVRRAEAAMARWQENGMVNPRVDTHVAAFALTAMISRFAYVWFTRGDQHDFDHVAEQLTLYWLSALGVPEADWDRPAVGANG